MGRATRTRASRSPRCPISIHALRGEGDGTQKRFHSLCKYFNPRPPWGGRRSPSKSCLGQTFISIHALRGEGDLFIVKWDKLKQNFNPRPPWGGRLEQNTMYLLVELFQSTPSVGRATDNTPEKARGTWISIHALRGEGDVILPQL